MTSAVAGCEIAGSAAPESVTPAPCDLWAERRAAFPLYDASGPVLEWMDTTDTGLEAACG